MIIKDTHADLVWNLMLWIGGSYYGGRFALTNGVGAITHHLTKKLPYGYGLWVTLRATNDAGALLMSRRNVKMRIKRYTVMVKEIEGE